MKTIVLDDFAEHMVNASSMIVSLVLMQRTLANRLESLVSTSKFGMVARSR